MKSFSHLYEVTDSDETIEKAVHKVCLGRKNMKHLERYASDEKKTAKKAKNWIENYKIIKHDSVEIYDGISRKKRTIIIPTFEELTVQHAVVMGMMPVFTHGMYTHTYASIPGRGTHKAKKVIEKWIKNDPENTTYILKMDIHHFFESIPHGVLKQKLLKKVHDIKMLDLIFKIIDTTESGLPLGFYTSQWLANFYLQDLDHYIKEQCKAKYYVRYMDDMVIFGSDPKTLHLIRYKINIYLKEELKLELKNNWQVFRFENGRDLDFLGFRFFRNRTILRKSIMLKATRKAKRIYKSKKLTVHDCRQILSYMGWINATNSYKLYKKYIKRFVSIDKCKQRISKFDRKGVFNQNDCKFLAA